MVFICLFRIERKRQAEIPEIAAKEKHQKLWEGLFIKIYYFPHVFFFVYFKIEKRAVEDARIRNSQIREIFSDLDTNGDSLYVIFCFFLS